VKNSDNIKAYVEKGPSSQLKKVKVETVVEASLSELISIIKDAGNHKEWVFMNENAEIIEDMGCKWKYYGTTDLPWPVYNRDIVTNVSLVQDTIDYSVTIVSISNPDYLCQYEDYIRVRHLITKWTLNPIGNGTVHILFEMEIDPGGNIPIWLVNMAVSRGPLKTMEAFIEKVKENKHKCYKIDFIEEFGLK